MNVTVGSQFVYFYGTNEDTFPYLALVTGGRSHLEGSVLIAMSFWIDNLSSFSSPLNAVSIEKP